MVYEPCVILKPECVHIARSARVDSFTKIEGGRGVDIGEFVHVGSYSHLNIGGGRLIMEDHCGCSSGVRIASATPDWNYLYVSAAEPEEHKHPVYYVTRICSYAVLFMGVLVVPGVTVGEGAIVKPGSVVTEDVPNWAIYQGNPAVRVGTRTIRTKVIPLNGRKR